MQIAELELESPVWTSTPLRRGIEPLTQRILDKFDCYIAGGYARWLVTDAPDDTYKDIDFVFTKRNSSIADIVGEFLEDQDMYLTSVSPYALTYVLPDSAREVLKQRSRKPAVVQKVYLETIQLIKPVTIENTNRELFGPPEKVLGNFDFTVCQVAYYKGEVVVSEKFLEDEQEKRIRIASLEGVGGYEEMEGLHPSLNFRIRSYYDKGYSIEVGELLKFLPNTWMDTGISRRYAIDLMKLPPEQRLTKEQVAFFFDYVVFQREWKLDRSEAQYPGYVPEKQPEYPL
jgi:hypothetical protein